MFVGLEETKTSTTTTEIDMTTDEITVADATNFSNNGFLYIDSEIMEYYKDGNVCFACIVAWFPWTGEF